MSKKKEWEKRLLNLVIKLEDALNNYDKNPTDSNDKLASKLHYNNVRKQLFGIDWSISSNYGVGSGTDYFSAHDKDDALRQFWEGKNKEEFMVMTIYQANKNSFL